MASKILCAGFSKEEKSAVEAEVKPVIAARPADESWTISLVKTGSRLAVSVDGPDDRCRAKNFVSELWELRQKLMDLLTNCGFPPSPIPLSPAPSAKSVPPTAMKSSPPAPMKSSPPLPKAAPFAPKPAPAPSKVAARPAAMAPPITPAPQRRVAAPLTPPPSRMAPPSAPHELEELEEYDWESPHSTGERRETHTCSKCSGRYAVVYESMPNEPRYTVAVACPHCWEVDHIEIGENAALSKQYRADRLS
jgi:hypothetical protein